MAVRLPACDISCGANEGYFKASFSFSSFFLDTDSLKTACSLTTVLMLFFFLNILCALVWLYGVSPKLLDYLYPALSLRFSFSFILLVRFRNTFLIRCQKKRRRKKERKGKEWLIEARDFSWSVLGWLYLQLSQLALHFHTFIQELKEERLPSLEHSALSLFTLILQLWMSPALADTALSGWVGLKGTWKHHFHCFFFFLNKRVWCSM